MGARGLGDRATAESGKPPMNKASGHTISAQVIRVGQSSMMKQAPCFGSIAVTVWIGAKVTSTESYPVCMTGCGHKSAIGAPVSRPTRSKLQRTMISPSVVVMPTYSKIGLARLTVHTVTAAYPVGHRYGEACEEGCVSREAGSDDVCKRADSQETCGDTYRKYTEWICATDDVTILRCDEGRLEFYRCENGASRCPVPRPMQSIVE